MHKHLIALTVSSVLLASIGCSTDPSATTDTSTGSTTGGSTGGSGTPTASTMVTFTAGNFESEIKFIGPRVHAIVGEVYRNLELIYEGTGQDMDQQMAQASAVPRNDLLDVDLTAANSDIIIQNGGTAPVVALEVCSNNGGISTVFFDFDGNSALSVNDVVLRDFDNIGCTYDFVADRSADPLVSVFDTADPLKERRIPTSITGSIQYRFTSIPATASQFIGTATFGDTSSTAGLNYEITNGLLEIVSSDSESMKGTVDFDIDFATGDATFSNINVRIEGGTGSLTGPNIITATSITRTLSSTPDTLVITGGNITSESTNTGIDFRTIAYNGNGSNELSAPDGGSPTLGAMLFEGGNNTAARVRTSLGGGMPIVDLETSFDAAQPLDNVDDPTTVNQFDDLSQAEPGGSTFFVTDFLLRPQ